jgi:protein TonB
LKNPAPIFPEYARTRGWEGTVILSVLVGSDGKVQKITVERSSKHQILDESALKTVRKWQFKPAQVGNLVFASWIKVPVRFVLVETNERKKR